MQLKVSVRYEGQSMAFGMPVGDGRMTIKWLGERAHGANLRNRLRCVLKQMRLHTYIQRCGENLEGAVHASVRLQGTAPRRA